MYGITDATNVIAPTGTYPHGELIDEAGLTQGTVLNKKLIEDVLQTMQQIATEAGFTPDGTPDNAVNGWRLLEAMRNLFAGDMKTIRFPLPAWNMESVVSVAIAHGSAFDFKKVMRISVIIRDDADTYRIALSTFSTRTSVFTVDSTNINIYLSAAYPASGVFSSTAFSRGYVIVEYSSY